jgi:large subunit ribosomal protein L15
MQLHSLENTSRPYKRRKLLGRGVGSGRGKTCCRGHKGAGARSGWKSRERYEGGQNPLYKRLPIRGFTNTPFQRKLDVVNLGQIDLLFSDGDTVNLDTLRKVGFLSGPSHGLKVLAEGELTKKVTIQAKSYSKQAEDRLQKLGITYSVI